MDMNIKTRLHGGKEEIKRWVETKGIEERIEGIIEEEGEWALYNKKQRKRKKYSDRQIENQV